MTTYINGNKRLDIEDGALTRASGAWNPVTGEAVRTNCARITPDLIKYTTWSPKIYHTFSGEIELNYAGLLARKTAFETSYVGVGKYTKLDLGDSFEGREMTAYRLGPITRKHCVFTCCVHGNEHDGINGAFKAMELFYSLPEYEAFRDEWTILFVPVMNPDGYFHDTRNLAHIGPNGETVNLNRNWDWWWGDYIESGDESKGAAPESEIETQNFLNYWRFGNAGGPVTFGCVFDMHANKDPGARYQSRDRVWARISEAAPFPVIPTSLLEMDFHMQVWKMARACQTLRCRADSLYPDLYIRAFHSRFNPHMHSYFSSQSVPAFILEEVKVEWSNIETYNTACDLRLDYCMALAGLLTQDNWVQEDGVLLEPAATNLLTNADFFKWSSTEARPQFFTSTQCIFERVPHRDGWLTDAGRHYTTGERVKLTARVNVALSNPAEYTASATAGANKSIVLVPSIPEYYLVNLGSGEDCLTILTPSARTAVIGAGMAFAATNTVDVLGGGTAAPATGASTSIDRVTYVAGGASTEGAAGNLNTARMFHGCCDNWLDYPTVGVGERAWVFGGFNAAGNRLTSIERWNPNTAVSTNMAAVLPAALADCVAVFYPPTKKVYIFGGTTAGGIVSTIYEYDTVADACVLHATPMTVGLKHAAGCYDPVTNKIYILGGEKPVPVGEMSYKIYSFAPSTGTYVFEDEILMDLDNQDEEDGQTRPWNVLLGRSTMSSVMASVSPGADSTLVVVGGRYDSTAGALSSDVYLFDTNDMVIGKASDTNFGYIRGTTALDDTKMATFYSDNFGGGLGGWSDPSTAWQNGGGFAEGVTGKTGWLICSTLPTYKNERIGCNVLISASGATVAPDWKAALRATFSGANLTDGYVVSYYNDGATQEWELSRVVSSVATVLDTLDVSAVPASKIAIAARAFEFRAESENGLTTSPVRLIVTFNGNTIFDMYDVDADKISTVGKMAFYGGATA